MQIDLDPAGCLILSDETGYRLILRPIGPTGDLIASILLQRQMGLTKLGQLGAPTQVQIDEMTVQNFYKKAAKKKLTELPGANEDFDL